ncbi:hypothetical protein TSTA_086490 [Talaromyces stipitatus ATCC 10500]|uniref:Uncharacterized protein n=1 Tax=Talaromyces stipitatus (strain ATCC 10500 / CBS 375.48 / QM 6759 / NRRL 1006) TaxID=441959 RepID=B8M0N3_TALSN|nr:uncharacterized protein TSTA_086490 [Talaromyces stipitatus ATCC 10500]EED21416.1 hypothetical protein TSTA_086490 [Talaromyces stipitatus ATCC 10500]
MHDLLEVQARLLERHCNCLLMEQVEQCFHMINGITEHELVPLHQTLEDVSTDNDDDRGQDEEMTIEESCLNLDTIHSIQTEPRHYLDGDDVALPEQRLRQKVGHAGSFVQMYAQGHWYPGRVKRCVLLVEAFTPAIRFQIGTENVDVEAGIYVKIELSPTRHPEAYARKALKTDPSSRLAIKIKGKLKNGEIFEEDSYG